MKNAIFNNTKKNGKLFIKTIIILFFIMIPYIGISSEKNYNYQTETYNLSGNITRIFIPYYPSDILKQNGKWTAFWITFIISAIGVYSLYGFAAGIIAVAVTYFVTNGNKRAFKMAILGCIAGCIVGGLILLGRLFI